MTVESLTEAESLMLARSLDESLGRILEIDALLLSAAEDRQLDTSAHAELASLGWAGVALTEADGGLGLDRSLRTLLCSMAGQRLLPAGLRGEAFVLAPLLAAHARSGAEGARDRLVALLAGDVRGAGVVGLTPEKGVTSVVATLPPGGTIVAYVSPSTSFLIDIEADGVTVEPFEALDPGQGAVRIGLQGASLGHVDLEGSARETILTNWRLAVLAEAFGAGRHALQMATAFAGNREQFGRKIATFQAVSHMLARTAVELEAANAGIGRMVARLDANLDVAALAEVLSHTVPGAARRACESSIQVHGGMGFTWELGLHLYYRRVIELQSLLGGGSQSARAVGARYLATRQGIADGR